MNNSLERFQDLLRELFQFDWADLDFGIYRILNYKREQVEEFITSRLPQIVDKAFGEYVEAEKTALRQELDRLGQQIRRTLVVDTRHFPEDFKWRLLASFDDLDEAIDGVLVKSENFQALKLLLERYGERVKFIYIDPPYNLPISLWCD